MSTLNILLIEDDEVDVMTVERALREAGCDHHLELAGNGRDAVERLESSASRPHLILLDLNLPLLSGLEFLAVVAESPRLRQIPVVILTTSGTDHDVERAFELGASGYFVKPVAFDEFVEVMRTLAGYWSLSRRSEIASTRRMRKVVPPARGAARPLPD